jgi:hypothetical protein
VVRFNLPSGVEEFAQSGSSSKSYKINPNLPVRQLLTMICRRLNISKPPESYQLRTLRGYPLRDECPLSMYGLGSLFASWELNVFVRLPTAESHAAASSSSSSSSIDETASSGLHAKMHPGATSPVNAAQVNRRSTRLQVSDLQQRSCLVSILLPPLLEFSALKQKRIKVDVQAPIGRIINSICAKHGVKDPDRLVLCTVLGSQDESGGSSASSAEQGGGSGGGTPASALGAGSSGSASSCGAAGPSSSASSSSSSSASSSSSSSSLSSVPSVSSASPASSSSEESAQVIVLANDKNLAWYGLGIRFQKWKLRLALREAILHHTQSQGAEEMSMQYSWTQIPEADLRLSEARSIIRDLDVGLRLYRRDLQQSQAVNSEVGCVVCLLHTVHSYSLTRSLLLTHSVTHTFISSSILPFAPSHTHTFAHMLSISERVHMFCCY